MMSDPSLPTNQETDSSETGASDSPRHGFRGHPEKSGGLGMPASLTIAISREAGSRGTSIAQRVGAKLGWQVYTQELLEYITQEGNFRQDLANQLSPAAHQWVEDRLNLLLREQNMSSNPTIQDMARILLSLGAHGEVILLGRGAGCILPAPSTLHVRLCAPLEDRIAYTSQWLRLTEEEATERVHKRDANRANFLSTHFHRKPDEVYQYDMVLNSSLLGEELCAELILQAAQAKRQTVVASDRNEEPTT